MRKNAVHRFMDRATYSSSDTGRRNASGLRLRRLGGGLRSWLAVRWTCTAALYLTAPPSCGHSAGLSRCVRLPGVFPIRGCIYETGSLVTAGLFLLSAFLLLAAAGPAFSADPHSSADRPGTPGETFTISVSAREPAQGDPVLVEVSVAPSPDNLAVVWKGRTIPVKNAGGGKYFAVIGVDLLEAPGKAPLTAKAARNGSVARAGMELTVRGRAFPVQEMTLPKTMTQFDDATLERIRREAERLEERFAAVSAPAWELPFLPPVEDFRPTGFGARRVINGEPRAPHAGVDIHVPAGTPVTAIAAGTVAFAGQQFFGGNSVVVDHGGGVFSIYYHLQGYTVAEGQRVAKGERIGAVGSSGRSTGPHLHFGVRAPGGRIDPSRLFGPSFH